jgi:hypothetical protein
MDAHVGHDTEQKFRGDRQPSMYLTAASAGPVRRAADRFAARPCTAARSIAGRVDATALRWTTIILGEEANGRGQRLSAHPPRRARKRGVGVGGTALGGTSSKAQTAQRKTFVLVHGAWHGGWCWRRVSDLLEQQGHKVFTPS